MKIDIKKLKMPKGYKEMKEMDMAEMMEDSYDEEMSYDEDDMKYSKKDMKKEEGYKMDSYSDEDLIAELKKRGLIDELDEENSEEEASEEA